MQQIERQIFIGGCSRSGTTLLGAILGAHSDCICPPESHFKISAIRRCQSEEGTIGLEEALRYIRMHWRFKLWDLEVDPAQAPDTSFADLLTWLVEAYARAAQDDRPAEFSTWIDHTPENINYAPLLLEIFPQSKIVHLVRDGRAVANSILPLDWGPNTVIKAASWWEDNVREGLALEASLASGQIVRVRYEDVVSQPERAVPQLCEELGLAYEPAMLQANGFRPPDYTSGQHTMIGKQPDPNRATRWKTTLTDRQVELFESLAGDLLEQMGYPLLYGDEARPPKSWERTAAGVKELVRGDLVNGVRWLIRSYPLWLSWDFLRVLPDTWISYRKADIREPTEHAEA